jgi:hypothetical protein
VPSLLVTSKARHHCSSLCESIRLLIHCPGHLLPQDLYTTLGQLLNLLNDVANVFRVLDDVAAFLVGVGAARRVPVPDQQVRSHAFEEVGRVNDDNDLEGESSSPALCVTDAEKDFSDKQAAGRHAVVVTISRALWRRGARPSGWWEAWRCCW